MREQEGKERRVYKRIAKHFILTYYDMADPQVRFAASQLRNISVGGMCLITSQPFPPGMMLGIELKTPYIAELTHLEGEVLGSRERVKGLIYETRMRFSELSPQARYVLERIVEHYDREEWKERRG